MPADNAAHLAVAARARSQAVRARAVQAIEQLHRSGVPVNFAAVAAHAGVSRSWLYRQTDLRARIENLRHDSGHRQPTPPPIRATPESLRAQNAALQTAIDRLTQENRRQAEQIEHLLGERRAAHRR